MIGWIEKQLKKLGVVSPFDKDDILNAQSDNKLHDYEQVAQEVRDETGKRRESNNHLKRVLSDANNRTNGFADFERLVRNQGDPNRE